MNFTTKELTQILAMSRDFSSFIEISGRTIPGLSLTAFKQDMLTIQMKCELLLAQLDKNIKGAAPLSGQK